MKEVIRLVILDKAKMCKQIFHFIYCGRPSWHVWCMLRATAHADMIT